MRDRKSKSQKKLVLRSDAKRGPPEEGGNERTSSRWPQIAPQNRATGEPVRAWGLVLCTTLRRGRDFSV